MAKYEVSGLGRSFVVWDNFSDQPVCKRDRTPFKTTDVQKALRLAGALNRATDAASIAAALIDFGANQSDAWRYAQTVYEIA